VDGKHGNLRVFTLDGHQYSWNIGKKKPEKLPLSPPRIEESYKNQGRLNYGGSINLPKNIGDELLIKQEILYDINEQKIVFFANGDYLISYKTLKGPKGKLQIARINKGKGFIWKMSESDLLATANESSHKLVLSAVNGDILYAVIEDYQSSDNVYLVAINIATGKKNWELLIN